MGVKAPPTLLNGGTNYAIATDDWPAAMEWLKSNTPQDSVIASWWDYGYWITTLSGRTSLADNATLVDWQIAKIGEMLLSNPDRAWQLLQEMGADYVLVYGVGQKINDASDPQPLYLLGGGGDESKKQWFMRISGNDLSKFLESDGFSGTENFWENTLLGKMFPFSIIVYANLETNEQSQVYVPGYTAVYVKDIKYPSDGDGPLKFAYASPSFYRDSAGVISGVFIYEVNKDYKPDLEKINVEPSDLQTDSEVAVITTTFGDITIQFKEDIAPQTVENFRKLTESGFYDGTIFHRIIPGFIIQGGDPNTISGERETWGTGDPGYTITPEFSEIKHKRFIVSMARGADVNSAGSQFFIVLDDAPWLDGQYTIFGEVISGQDVVEKIAILDTNTEDQPIDPDKASIEKIIIVGP